MMMPKHLLINGNGFLPASCDHSCYYDCVFHQNSFLWEYKAILCLIPVTIFLEEPKDMTTCKKKTNLIYIQGQLQVCKNKFDKFSIHSSSKYLNVGYVFIHMFIHTTGNSFTTRPLAVCTRNQHLDQQTNIIVQVNLVNSLIMITVESLRNLVKMREYLLDFP